VEASEPWLDFCQTTPRSHMPDTERAMHAQLRAAIRDAGASWAARLRQGCHAPTAGRFHAHHLRTRVGPRSRITGIALTLSNRRGLRAETARRLEGLRVLPAQHSLAEARLECNRTLREAWRMASELAGLLLEEDWPAGEKTAAVTPRDNSGK
jgi:hypothetical protein